MLLDLDRHDGVSNSNATDALVQNLSAAAAANLENCHKMASIRLLVAMRAASTAAAETSTGDFGLAETVVIAPFRRAVACIAPPLRWYRLAASAALMQRCPAAQRAPP